MPNHQNYFEAKFVSYHKDKLRYLITTNGVDIDPESIICWLEGYDARATKNLLTKEENAAHYMNIDRGVGYEVKTVDKGVYVVTFDKMPLGTINPRLVVTATNNDAGVTDDSVR